MCGVWLFDPILKPYDLWLSDALSDFGFWSQRTGWFFFGEMTGPMELRRMIAVLTECGYNSVIFNPHCACTRTKSLPAIGALLT